MHSPITGPSLRSLTEVALSIHMDELSEFVCTHHDTKPVPIERFGSYFWVQDCRLWSAPMDDDGEIDKHKDMYSPVNEIPKERLDVVNHTLRTHFKWDPRTWMPY